MTSIAVGPPRVRGTVMLAGALLASAIGLQIGRDRVIPPAPELLPVLWMRSPQALDRMSLSYDDLVADVYWIRAVVYYGSVRRSEAAVKSYDLLYPLLDVTTTLDPRFLLAYRMGAIFLSEGYPGGPGRPDLAIALLEKGLQRNAGDWRLLHDIGFVYFWTYRDYVQAAAWLRRASEAPGAPAWLKPVAGGMLMRGGDRATARALWHEIGSSEIEAMRDVARRRLAQLDALDQIDQLHSLISRVTLASGVRPRSWGDLIARRVLPGVPLDPSGTPYELHPDTGRVDVSADSRLFPMPDDLDIPTS
jgi:hypothetical protein